ncbi:MAG TPA: hypothetical protein VGH56_08255 [Solirubrobacteraceae bacterium]
MSPIRVDTFSFTDSHLSQGAHNVTWIPAESATYAPPPLPKANDRSEQTSAIIVMVLTLACTALAMFDLFLLAAGS